MTAEPTRLVIGNANDMLRVADELTLLEDRRQSAREAYYDRVSLTRDLSSAFDEAIAVATRVKITDEIVVAAQQAFPVLRDVDEGRAMLTAAFRAAGFEVVE